MRAARWSSDALAAGRARWMAFEALMPCALLLGTLLLGAVLVTGCGGGGGKIPVRNVVLITLDTTRADHLGLYGYKRPTSPTLDALAPSATVFDLAIVQAAVTPISHATILTGLCPNHHGLRFLLGQTNSELTADKTTLADIWDQAGGETAAFVSAYPMTASYGLSQGFQHFDADFARADSTVTLGANGLPQTMLSQRRADETTDHAIEWLRQRPDPKKPLFMWVHYFDPHDAVVKPPEEIMAPMMRDKFPPASMGKEDVLRSAYDAEICFMDFHLGRLLRELMRLGIYEETMLVIIADHGEGLGDHNWWAHGILYQEQIHVPLLIRVPGMTGGGRVSSMVRAIDVVPTILDATRVPRKLWPALDGVSLLSAMRTGKTERPLTAYSESLNMLRYDGSRLDRKSDESHDKLYCLIDGTQKLIYHQLEPEQTELYDLTGDPKETRNVARRGEGEATTRLLDVLSKSGAITDITVTDAPTEPTKLEGLRSLGYIK
jgi:arylsulfatase A-like enzyme